MDEERTGWTYTGPVTLVEEGGAQPPITADAELSIKVEAPLAFDSVLPGRREWVGEATLTDRTQTLYLVGLCQVTLPSGQHGAAWVTTTITQEIGKRELCLTLQGIGQAPWLL